MEVNNLNTNRRAQIGNITIPLLKGDQGYSISRIVRTSGDGGAGTTDTYTVYIDTDPETAIGTFQVVNGTGGDMSKNVYDIDNDDIVDRATGDGNGNEITATYETIENVTALASRVATLEQAGYITKSVADLANYYLKSETYTKQEVNNLCDMIPKFAIEVVSVLPTQDISETTIYLLRDDEETLDVYQEYIYVNNTWERIGGQRIDLSNYYQKSETYSKEDLNGKLVNVGTEAPENGERVWFKKSRNLFNIDSQFRSSTDDYINSVTNNGFAFVKPSQRRLEFYINNREALPAGTYTISFDILENTSTTEFQVLFRTNTTTEVTILVPSQFVGRFSQTINLTSGTTNVLYAFINNNQTDGTKVTINNVQIQEGSTATDYEPFIENPSINVDEEEWYSKPKVLWTNPNITTDFAEQTISLLDNLANYSHYEILYFLSKDNTETFTTGKIPIDKDTRISVPRHFIGYRSIQPRGTSMYLSNHSQFTTYGQTTSTNTNGICIPYQILGYKE